MKKLKKKKVFERKNIGSALARFWWLRDCPSPMVSFIKKLANSLFGKDSPNYVPRTIGAVLGHEMVETLDGDTEHTPDKNGNCLQCGISCNN